MTTIRATCPSCGEVDLTPADVFLAIRTPASRYRFVCPVCNRDVEKPADRKVVALLVSAGVNLGDGTPAVPSILPDNAGLPPLTREDAQAFRDLLATADVLGHLVEGA